VRPGPVRSTGRDPREAKGPRLACSADATLVLDAPRLRRFLPYISPRRNDSLVYFESEVEIEAALDFLRERNGTAPREQRTTLFHLVLRAIARALHERPHLNRFTAGGRLWQRRGVWITFSAKQELTDGAPILTVKREFPAGETLSDLVDDVATRLRERRSGELERVDREMGLALRFPPSIVRPVVALLRAADRFGALPGGMIRDDPLFTSVFVANLGSIGLDAAYHHLWEWGTCGIFVTIGRVRKGPSRRRVLRLRYSFDERVEDGLYAAISIDGMRRSLESPRGLV